MNGIIVHGPKAGTLVPPTPYLQDYRMPVLMGEDSVSCLHEEDCYNIYAVAVFVPVRCVAEKEYFLAFVEKGTWDKNNKPPAETIMLWKQMLNDARKKRESER